LFERYLRLGPGNYPAPSKDYDYENPVGFASLNVTTPSNADSDGLLPDNLGTHYACMARTASQLAGGTGREVINPKALLQTLLDWFGATDYLEKQESGPKHLGELLERVGRLGFALDGVVQHRRSNTGFDGHWEDEV
jgi:hypothetical protein